MDAPNRTYARDLLIALTLAAGLHALLIARAEVPARDAVGFVRLARHLESPPHGRTFGDVLREAQHPPGFPLLVNLTSRPLRLAGGGVTCENMVLAARLAAAAAGTLLVFPVYGLGRRLFGGRAGLTAALLVQTLPVFAQVSSDALSDSTFLLWVMAALWLAAAPPYEQSALRGTVCGLSCGLAYLIRPEGLLFVGVIGLHALARSPARAGLKWGGAMAAGLAAVSLPYILTIGGLSNKPTFNVLTDWLLRGEAKPVWHQGSVAGSLLAVWREDAAGECPLTPLWACRALAEEFFKASHYLPGVAGVAGAFHFARGMGRSHGMSLLALAGSAYAGMVWVMAAKIGYLSERHALPVAVIAALFAAGFVPKLGAWLARFALVRRGDAGFWRHSAAVCLIAPCLAAAAGERLHANRRGHLEAGLWLRANSTEEDEIVDPFEWAAFYAGRSWGVPGERTYAPDATVFVVVEEEGDRQVVPHSRLPQYAQAMFISRAGRVEFSWPAHADGGDKRVVVYRIDR